MGTFIPASVQRELDQADAIEVELYGQPEALEPENTDAAPGETVDDAVPVEQPAEADAAPVVQPPAKDDVWEQKFNVLRGKYEAEVPRLHAQVRELSEQLQIAIQAMQQPTARPPETEARDTDADEKFGSDLMDAVRRTAKEEAARATRDIDDRVKTAVKPVADKLTQNDADRFWNAVDSSVPDFEQVNNDPKWFQFLDTRIVGTKMSRRDAANAAVARNDAPALIELVEAWKQEVAPVPSPLAVDPRAKENLNRQVAPTSRRDAEAPKSQGRVWTGDEYKEAQDPRNMNRMSRSEYDALVAESDLALEEGRVQW